MNKVTILAFELFSPKKLPFLSAVEKLFELLEV